MSEPVTVAGDLSAALGRVFPLLGVTGTKEQFPQEYGMFAAESNNPSQ